MLKRNIPVALALGALLFTGCYPDGADYISDYDLVYTNYSPSFNFKAATTYSIPDSIPLVTGDLAEGETPDFVNAQYSDVILDRVRQNMNSRGWQEVEVGQEPDVVMLASAIKSENVSYYYYYGGYWGWYYPYYGYGWYYPGYYPTYTSYTSGSLVLQMVVPDEPSATDNIPVMWVAVLNSVLEGSSLDLIDRLETNVDQAFTQSEYLKH